MPEESMGDYGLGLTC